MASTKTRPRRAPRVHYHDLSDSDDFDVHSQQSSSRSSRPSRAARQIRTYRESSNDESSAESVSQSSSDEAEGEIQPRIRHPPRNSQRKPPPSRLPDYSHQPHLSARQIILKRKKQDASSTLPFASYKQRKIFHTHTNRHAKASTDTKPSQVPPVMPGRIPPWQELPYHVLKNIMMFASYPLYQQASRSTPSISWLCATSTLCRTFHEACMAALLYSPPLYPPQRAHGLIALLRQGRNKPMIEYRSKIHRLDIEVKQLLAKKSGIDMEILLNQTPLLREMRLYSNYDDLNTIIWAQRGATKSKWTYPEQLFDLLEERNIVLTSFEWNGRFPNALEVLEVAAKAHAKPSFCRLQNVAFLNLGLTEKASPAEKATAHSLLGSALDQLHEVRRLTLRNCDIIDSACISTLPKHLSHLEISNCLYLDSPAIDYFLTQGGANLRSLKLSGNQSMSLEFMSNLQSLCPRLEDLEIDLLYIDPTSYNDRVPLYDELLPNGPPTWPETLINISLDNLRQLSAEDAEGFLGSLVDASEKLPYLKTINIKAILNGSSWRDRAELRRKWLPRLENVFLNTTEPPKDQKGKTASPKTKTISRTTTQRQSKRIATNLLHKSSGGESSDSDTAKQSTARHARCDIVNLVISDQRPAQDQFREDDFLDDEPSGDEEWNERSDGPRLAAGYAW